MDGRKEGGEKLKEDIEKGNNERIHKEVGRVRIVCLLCMREGGNEGMEGW